MIFVQLKICTALILKRQLLFYVLVKNRYSAFSDCIINIIVKNIVVAGQSFNHFFGTLSIFFTK